jgi:DNA-binding NtrC family response regulator
VRIGAYDYIVKPFDINELNLVIGRCFQKQRLASEVAEPTKTWLFMKLVRQFRGIKAVIPVAYLSLETS